MDSSNVHAQRVPIQFRQTDTDTDTDESKKK
jgi:hypothetical protein